MKGQWSSGTFFAPLAILVTIEGGTRRWRASAEPRPRDPESQVLSNMGAIVLPNGYNVSIPNGNFRGFPMGNTSSGMLTIAETRRARLEELITRYAGMLANLNAALGYERNDTRLARVRNANARTDRPGKVFQMGDPQAREIEEKLGLERGWMDTPPGYADLSDRRISHVLKVMEAMPDWQRDQAVKIVDTLAQPEPAKNNGDPG
jgi:hypothetical protein